MFFFKLLVEILQYTKNFFQRKFSHSSQQENEAGLRTSNLVYTVNTVILIVTNCIALYYIVQSRLPRNNQCDIVVHVVYRLHIFRVVRTKLSPIAGTGQIATHELRHLRQFASHLSRHFATPTFIEELYSQFLHRSTISRKLCIKIK